MRKLLIGAALAAFAAPAFADTLKEIADHGLVMTIEGIGDFDIAYTPDGKFTAKNAEFEASLGMPITGTWRLDGDKLCTVSNVQPEEQCVVYPKDKKSGDTFDITTDAGTVKIRIK